MLDLEGRSANPAPSSRNLPLIELSQVSKTYHVASGRFTALKSIDLRASVGEFLAIVGKSGSGKSTLINMMTGIDRPTSGKVQVAGTLLNDLAEASLASWRGKTVGIVFQFFQLLPTLTIAENVMLPMDFCNTFAKRTRRKRALELLDQVDIADQADKLPAALSGGQQQRAAIARALANDPAILVADEPTGNLDSNTADAILALFSYLAESGKTVIMVTHERDVAELVDRTILLADGQIVQEISPTKGARIPAKGVTS